jgi:hypothetical protein
MRLFNGQYVILRTQGLEYRQACAMKTTSPMWHVAAIMEPEHLDRAANTDRPLRRNDRTNERDELSAIRCVPRSLKFRLEGLAEERLGRHRLDVGV